MAASGASGGVVPTNTTESGRAAPNERARTSTALPLGQLSGAEPNDAETVPVALIDAAAFNVIDFKPMLCIDNGFISDSKPTGAEKPSAAHRSWEETASMGVLPIRCKNTSAELHKSRFGSGGRGACIRFEGAWYTPSEFESLCGRASSKDWKRSIRFGGRSIHALIEAGYLTPHAVACTCGACCGDGAADGPVRLYTPYKRKRPLDGLPGKRAKSQPRRDTTDSELETTHSGDSPSKEAWQSLDAGLDGGANYRLLEVAEAASDAAPDVAAVLKRLEDIGSQLDGLVAEYNRCVEEVRLVTTQQAERLEQERAAAMLAMNVDVTVQASLQSLDRADPKRCANCDREASAECSLCRRTPYCSIFCQRKDWSHHQVECLRSVPLVDGQQESIMVIVEGEHLLSAQKTDQV